MSFSPASMDPGTPGPIPASDVPEVLAALRQSLAAGRQPPSSIIQAAVEFARILTGANGVALALRNKSVIACRARSGDLAPDIGMPINVESGISGECLRTGSILLCNDAASDTRVDAEACRALGVRSILIVPLRGAKGIDGILEAFSTRVAAFGIEEVNALSGLAEISQTAYQQECASQDLTEKSVPVVSRKESILPPIKDATVVPRRETSTVRVPLATTGMASPSRGKPSRWRSYWILGAAAIVLLLTSAVMWLNWRSSDLEAAEAQPLSADSEPSSHTPPAAIAEKRGPSVAGHSTRSQPTGGLQNAATIEHEGPPSGDSGTSTSLPIKPRNPSVVRGTESAAIEAPPSIEVAVSIPPDRLSSFASAPVAMPALGAQISKGATQAILIHQVDPTYPPQALVQRIEGAVTLDATITEKGVVSKVEPVTGPKLLSDAATEAVRQWRYSPFLLSGRPVVGQTRITVVFKLPR